MAASIRAARRDYPPDEVEIVVVDGGSRDATLAQIPPDVKLIRTWVMTAYAWLPAHTPP
ncbi:MAG: hypothetical protein SVR81_00745 [Chloroflexota bacterium]|nr:hypothetical protein [Chloroflexota bacterium]